MHKRTLERRETQSFQVLLYRSFGKAKGEKSSKQSQVGQIVSELQAEPSCQHRQILPLHAVKPAEMGPDVGVLGAKGIKKTEKP